LGSGLNSGSIRGSGACTGASAGKVPDSIGGTLGWRRRRRPEQRRIDVRGLRLHAAGVPASEDAGQAAAEEKRYPLASMASIHSRKTVDRGATNTTERELHGLRCSSLR
jgi:hypothetical protein